MTCKPPRRFLRLPPPRQPRAPAALILAAMRGQAPQQTAFVFNCQLGRGRTTTGMVSACICWSSLMGDAFDARDWELGHVKDLDASGEDVALSQVSSATGGGGGGGGNSGGGEVDGSSGSGGDGGSSGDATADLHWGEYGVVRAVVHRLRSGFKTKRFVDAAIERCDHMQNLRKDILVKKQKAESQSSSAQRRASELRTGLQYLERYVYLILFNAYVCNAFDKRSRKFDSRLSSAGARTTFHAWLNQQNTDLQLFMLLDKMALE
eukprot:6199708-Pleurochrysis_carterae.AAC.1